MGMALATLSACVAVEGVNGSGPASGAAWRKTSPPTGVFPPSTVKLRTTADSTAIAVLALSTALRDRHLRTLPPPPAGGSEDPPDETGRGPDGGPEGGGGPGGGGGGGGSACAPPPDNGPGGGPVGRSEEGGREFTTLAPRHRAAGKPR